MATGRCIRPGVLGSLPRWSEPIVFSARRPRRLLRRAAIVVPSWRVVRAMLACAAASAMFSACEAPASDRGARASSADASTAIIDDFGDTLRLAAHARRVVSLNPVMTEAMYALHAESRLVGRTRWDAAPPTVRSVPDVGDGMQPNVEAVLAARPDLVVLYAAAANRAAASSLRRAGVQTLAMRTDRVDDFERALSALAIALGDTATARIVTDSVRRSIESVASLPPMQPPVTVFWHAWDAPLITIGAGSFLGELVTIAGARNAEPRVDTRQPVHLDLRDRPRPLGDCAPAGRRRQAGRAQQRLGLSRPRTGTTARRRPTTPFAWRSGRA